MSDHFQSCQAGRQLAGIEADDVVKGCPSLPSSYQGGSLRDASFEHLWAHAPQVAFTRSREVEALWGFGRSCPLAATCLGGGSLTAHALMGRPGNNPYRHYRARSLAPAPGEPFDVAQFELLVEPFETAASQPGATAQARRKAC